jgi:anti-sigma-K factor RskA
MNKPMVGKPVQQPAPATRPERSITGAPARQSPPKQGKPTGPVIYRLEKGADVWPGRK